MKKVSEKKSVKAPKLEKVSDHTLAKVKELLSMNQKLAAEIGGIEFKKSELLAQHAQIKAALNSVDAQIREEFGKVQLNIQTGELTPVEETAQDS